MSPTDRPIATAPWHGTVGGYTNHRCRCDDCRQAHGEYSRQRRAERRRLVREDSDSVVHGLASTYSNWGCRCAQCRQAHRASIHD